MRNLILDKEATKDVTVFNIKPFPEFNILTSHMRRKIDINHVLLDLGYLLPWGVGTPLGDIIKRDHRSGLTFSFGRSRQRVI